MGVGRERSGATIKGERVYQARNHELRCFIREGEGDTLLVVFASYHVPGERPRYTYTKLLADLPMPQLFILDDHGPQTVPPRPCWYLGRDRQFTVAADVHELIDAARIDLGLSRVVCAGSSKGGYAAIYFALTGGYERAIAGEPQTMLGTYLHRPSTRDILQHITGGLRGKERDWLNNLLADTARQSPHKPLIEMHAGRRTGYLEREIRPLFATLAENEIPYTLDVGDYDSHDQLSAHFPVFLRERLDLPEVQRGAADDLAVGSGSR